MLENKITLKDKINKHEDQILNGKLCRRKFLTMGLSALASLIIPCNSLASIENLLESPKSLCFQNSHTNERLETVYWQNGKYIPDALTEINHIFRDHYNGLVKAIDKNLLDLLFSLKENLKATEPFHLISGYRSPQTNSTLRKRSGGVAKKSLHMDGMAADIYLPGFSLSKLRHAAVDLRAGGVGYYPRSGFIHVDVGTVRYW